MIMIHSSISSVCQLTFNRNYSISQLSTMSSDLPQQVFAISQIGFASSNVVRRRPGSTRRAKRLDRRNRPGLPLSLSQSPPTKSQAFQTPGKISNA
jgi:hypothetical protein